VLRRSRCGDAAHATAASRALLLFKYVPTPRGLSATSDFDAVFDDFGNGWSLIGEAEQVKDEILRYAEIARTDHILLRVQSPGLAHQEALRNIERIGRIIAALS
jgi:alkanesulfonate monooxygenase SsuD/methylene tetrahydromethanopterin reductase-like flavin-dependent oxidoreductase (luciferase family)